MKSVQSLLCRLIVIIFVFYLSVSSIVLEAFAERCSQPPRELMDRLYDSTGTSLPMSYRLEETASGPVLLAAGSIEEGEALRLAHAIQQAGHRLAEVWLYSLGGVSSEGVEMGRLIRKKGLATRIPKGAVCFSACSMVFLGGVLRTVDTGGYYGVHMWTRYGEEGTVKLLSEILEIINAVGSKKMTAEESIIRVKNKLQEIEQHNADYARQRANYLIEMSISLRLMIPNVRTKSGNEHWLCPDELQSYNVVNTR